MQDIFTSYLLKTTQEVTACKLETVENRLERWTIYSVKSEFIIHHEPYLTVQGDIQSRIYIYFFVYSGAPLQWIISVINFWFFTNIPRNYVTYKYVLYNRKTSRMTYTEKIYHEWR